MGHILRVHLEICFIYEAEDVIIVEEIVEESALIACHCLEPVLLVLPPEFLLLGERHRLGVDHHV